MKPFKPIVTYGHFRFNIPVWIAKKCLRWKPTDDYDLIPNPNKCEIIIKNNSSKPISLIKFCMRLQRAKMVRDKPKVMKWLEKKFSKKHKCPNDELIQFYNKEAEYFEEYAADIPEKEENGGMLCIKEAYEQAANAMRGIAEAYLKYDSQEQPNPKKPKI